MHKVWEIFQGYKGNKNLKLKSCEENKKRNNCFYFYMSSGYKVSWSAQGGKIDYTTFKILIKF